MIQKKKFSDAISANIGVVEGLLHLEKAYYSPTTWIVSGRSLDIPIKGNGLLIILNMTNLRQDVISLATEIYYSQLLTNGSLVSLSSKQSEGKLLITRSKPEGPITITNNITSDPGASVKVRFYPL